jgi:rhodanese-related sulfurtransferase
MNWTTLILVAGVVVVFFLLRHSGKISVKDARGYLKKGALVIDVRSAAEFIDGHLPNALNLPLSEIEAILPRHVADKHRVLLLHCQSGARSAIARKMVKKMGYPQVFNLGSYARAAEVVNGR